MSKLTFKIKGLSEFQDKIAQLPQHIHNNAASRATAKAAACLKEEVKKAVPLAKRGSYAAMFKGKKITRKRGDLPNALILKRLRKDEVGNFASKHKVVFWRNDQTKGIGYIAHFLEGDVKKHDIKQQRRTVEHGGTDGTRFFSRTTRQSRKKMNKIMEKEILKAIREYFK